MRHVLAKAKQKRFLDHSGLSALKATKAKIIIVPDELGRRHKTRGDLHANWKQFV